MLTMLKMLFFPLTVAWWLVKKTLGCVFGLIVLILLLSFVAHCAKNLEPAPAPAAASH